MLEMIEERRTAEKKEERYDLFSTLLDATDSDSDGSVKLTDQEVLGQCLVNPYSTQSVHVSIGNIFIFLLAGELTRVHCAKMFSHFCLP